MTVLVDTSVLIDHLRGLPEAREVLGRAVDDGERLIGSVLTRSEILAGLRPGEEEATSALLGVLEWIVVDEAIADHAGALAQRYFASHGGIDLTDYVIAATAAMHGATLWTRNVKHFPMMAGLRPPY